MAARVPVSVNALIDAAAAFGFSTARRYGKPPARDPRCPQRGDALKARLRPRNRVRGAVVLLVLLTCSKEWRDFGL
jgi:hypothetical protein